MTSLVALLVYGVPHFIFHMTHLELFDTVELIKQVIVVGSFIVVQAALLLVPRRRGAVVEAVSS